MTGRSSLEYRPDIDGLRAIAILAVVFYHTFPDLFRGGFIGVDVFFVISGYLISLIIFRNLETNQGRFDFYDFYERRIKRIFPALILVLSALLLIGWMELFSDEFTQLGKHISASSVFISNFILWREAGYFDNSADLKPLLHLWSLGVEEQFYIFWPFIVALSWKLKKFLTVTFILIGLSFVLNIWRINKFPVETFFLPFSRIWELLTGSLLAYATYTNKTLLLNTGKNNIQNDVLSVMGGGGVLLPIFLFTQKNSYPGYYVLFPTFGTLFLLIANHSYINKIILGSRPLIYLGRISYPLYLWHWPILSLLNVFNRTDIFLKIICVFFSFILASLTYLFVEKPIRKSSLTKIKTVIILILLLGVLGVFGKTIEINAGFPNRLLKLELEREQLANKKESEYMSKECLTRFQFDTGFCIGNFKNPKILLIGDSQANQLTPIFISSTNKKLSSSLLNLGQGACPITFGLHTIETKNTLVSEDMQENCVKITNAVFDLLKNPEIETVIFFNLYDRYFSGMFKTAPDKETYRPFKYEEYLTDTFSRIIKNGKKLIIILPIPEVDFDIRNCVTKRPFLTSEKPENLICSIPKKKVIESQVNIRKYLKTLSENLPIRIFDPLLYLCDEQFCYVKNPNGLMLYHDSLHLSINGAQYLSPYFSMWYEDQSQHPE